LGTQSEAEALSAAVRSNDARNVRAVLQRFPELASQLNDVMPGGHFGQTPLLAAVNQGNREMVDVLLEAGADIDGRSHWWAGSFGVLDNDGALHDFLIERGATIDAHAAARLGRLDILRDLLTRDPSLVHARGGDGQLPLHFASTVEVATLLLELGANIDAIDVDHESTAAQWMVKDRPDVARFLVARGCRSDLLLAAALGEEDRVRAHLADDPTRIRMTVSDEWFPRRDPRSGGTIYNWTLGTGKGPHVIAREFGHERTFRFLLDQSPAELQLAVWSALAERDQVLALLGREPDLARRLSAADQCTLPDAARDEKVEAVRLMLDAGWPIDARGQHGATAVHWAAFHGHLELVRLLLDRRAPLDVVDTDHHGTPLAWALYGSLHGWRCATGNYAAVVEALLDAGATPPPGTADNGASEDVREVLRRRYL